MGAYIPENLGFRLTPSERGIINIYSTPRLVQRFLSDEIAYNYGETTRSFREVVRQRKADCLEGALTAAAILQCQGMSILLLDLRVTPAPGLDHVVFILSTDAGYGAIGKSRDQRLGGRPPVYPDFERLAESYLEPMDIGNSRLHSFGVLDLSRLAGINWRVGQNIGNVIDHLNRAKHYEINPKGKSKR